MRFLAFVSSVVLLTLTLAMGIKVANPKMYLQMALAVDVFGFSETLSREKSRLEKIDLLPISNDKKNILVNNTVFIGATTGMVKLALGNPARKAALSDSSAVNGDHSERWTYHLEDTRVPIVLYFRGGILESVESRSLLANDGHQEASVTMQ